MKTLLTLSFLFCITLATAQVGINTTTPNAQLEIKSSNETTPTNTDGIIIPKINAFPATNPTAAQQGMMVYLTTAVGANVHGFYYWDNTGTPAWKPVAGTGGTLDNAYDFGGAGLGKTITADAGAVLINGTDGLVSTGTLGSGAIAPSGTGVKMFWNPRKAAFRVGSIFGTDWDDINIGNYSIAFGRDTDATADNSTAFGFTTTASGNVATAFGDGTTAFGNFSTAFGDETSAFGNVSTAFGHRNTATSYGETVFGIGATNYTTSVNGATQFRTANASDRLLVVGNAIDADADGAVNTAERSDALIILKSGLTTLPSTTNTMIDSANGKAVVTKEWVQANSSGTLDDSYDFGGSGLGKTITADAGAVLINGTDGLVSTGTIGSGAVIPNATGVRMYWYPRKAAFRAGSASGTQWDDANIGTNSVAFGLDTTASGFRATAFGFNTDAISNTATAFGGNTTASGSSSTAFGSFSTASGNISTAFGSNSIASGLRSTAFGFTSTASADVATAFGNLTNASGNISTAFGSSTTASGLRSTAFGLTSIASADTATAFGSNTTASGFRSTAFGFTSTASADTATAFGSNTTASGLRSTAFGLNSIADGSISTAFGQGNTASSYGETIVGTYSTTYMPSINGATQFTTSNFIDRLFVVGNGYETGSSIFPVIRRDALIILKSGLTRLPTTTNAMINAADGKAIVTKEWALANVFSGTLDNAYDSGGAGQGKTITADAGAVLINGTDGFVSVGIGPTIDLDGNLLSATGALAPTGAGTRIVWNPRKSALRAGSVTGAQWDDVNIGAHSIALGLDNTSSGLNSKTFGHSCIASGVCSTALGHQCTASGVYSFAFGSDSRAIGEESTAFGRGSTAFGRGSTAFGFGANAYANASTAFGDGSAAGGTSSTAFGFNNEANGQRSTAFGSNTIATAFNSTAFGFETEASGSYSTAFGSRNTAPSYGEIVLGIGASTYTPSVNGVNGWGPANASDRLFVVGNAIDDNNDNLLETLERSNALVILKNGNTGIGTSTPVGQFELSLNQGRKPGSATWTIVSDKRLKNINGKYTKGLNEIIQLNPVRYNYKNTGTRNFEQEVLDTEFSGFIAQEIQPLFPDAVKTDDDGYLSFNMHSILVASINAFKELNDKNKSLETENDTLKKEVQSQKTLLQNIINRLEKLENK